MFCRDALRKCHVLSWSAAKGFPAEPYDVPALRCAPAGMTLGEFVAPDCDPGPLAARVGISLIGPSYPFCSNRRAERGEHYEWRRLRRPLRTRRTLRMAALTPPPANDGVDAAAGSPAWRDPVSRVPRPPAPARQRALAPARFARLIARASRRTHFACASNRGRSAPGRREGKRSARTPPPLNPS